MNYIQIGVGLLGIAFGVGLLGSSPFGWVLIAAGAVMAQIGTIAAGVEQGTDRLHRALGELDDAVSVLDPTE